MAKQTKATRPTLPPTPDSVPVMVDETEPQIHVEDSPPEPNQIRWVGEKRKDLKGEEVESDPPKYIESGAGARIKLPDADEQRSGFTHKRYNEILNIPGYKRVDSKG